MVDAAIKAPPPGKAVNAADSRVLVDAQLFRANMAIRGHRRWAEGMAEHGIPGAKQCVEFVLGKQYSEEEYAVRRSKKKPILTINKVRPKVQMLYGHYLNQRSQIAIRPGDDNFSSDDVADTLTKLVNAICHDNQFDHLQGDLFLDGIMSGRGFMDVRLDFSQNHLGKVVLSTADPFMTFPDPEAKAYDPAEWGYVSEIKWLSVEDVLVSYGKVAREKARKLVDADAWRDYGTELGAMEDIVSPDTYFGLIKAFERVDEEIIGGSTYSLAPSQLVDRQRKLVAVIETQHKEMVRQKQFVDLITGQRVPIPGDWPREKIQAALQWTEMVGTQKGIGQTLGVVDALAPRWRWTVTAADQLLYDDWSLYAAPTLVPFFPFFVRGTTHGVVHDLVDPQREINRRRTNQAEILSKIASGGWIYEADSMTPEQEANLQQYGSTPGVNVKFKAGKNPPVPMAAAQFPTGHNILEAQATEDMKEITNLPDAALGMGDASESGRSVLAKQKQSAIGQRYLVDNSDKTLWLIGKRIVSIIQGFYTEQRIFRERGSDGADTVYEINQRMAGGAIVNDVTAGEYRVAIDKAPVTASYEDLEFDQLKELVEMGLPIPPEFLIQSAPLRNKRQIIDAVTMLMGGQPVPAGGGAPAPAPAQPRGAPQLSPAEQQAANGGPL